MIPNPSVFEARYGVLKPDKSTIGSEPFPKKLSTGSVFVPSVRLVSQLLLLNNGAAFPMNFLSVEGIFRSMIGVSKLDSSSDNFIGIS